MLVIHMFFMPKTVANVFTHLGRKPILHVDYMSSASSNPAMLLIQLC